MDASEMAGGCPDDTGGATGTWTTFRALTGSTGGAALAAKPQGDESNSDDCPVAGTPSSSKLTDTDFVAKPEHSCMTISPFAPCAGMKPAGISARNSSAAVSTPRMGKRAMNLWTAACMLPGFYIDRNVPGSLEGRGTPHTLSPRQYETLNFANHVRPASGKPQASW